MITDQVTTDKKASASKKWFLIGGVGFGLMCICLVIVGVLTVPSLLRMTSSEGGTYSGIASEQLKNDVLAAISNTQGCPTASLYSGQLMISPDQSADGSWSEIWQVLVCGESHMYSISFTSDGAGGTFFSVDRMDE